MPSAASHRAVLFLALRRKPLASMLYTLLLVLAASVAQADITPPAGLVAGDQFRLIFVSSASRDATSSDIADYDAFISDVATAAGLGTYNGLTVSWHALGSTLAVNAIDRLPDSSVAIYNMNGDVVANAAQDIWSGSILNAIWYDENGNFSATAVWTGTLPNGTHLTGYDLGSSNGISMFGVSSRTDGGWTGTSGFFQTDLYPLYGYSDVITVAASAAARRASGISVRPDRMGLTASRNALRILRSQAKRPASAVAWRVSTVRSRQIEVHHGNSPPHVRHARLGWRPEEQEHPVLSAALSAQNRDATWEVG